MVSRSKNERPVAPAASRAPSAPGRLLSPERVLARLVELTAQRGAVSSRWIDRNEPSLLRGIRVHFGGLPEARRAANVARPPSGVRRWSELAVINELRRIQRAGRVRITVPGLLAAGYDALVGAIPVHVGTIARARRLARIPDPGTLPVRRIERWDEDRVIEGVLHLAVWQGGHRAVWQRGQRHQGDRRGPLEPAPQEAAADRQWPPCQGIERCRAACVTTPPLS